MWVKEISDLKKRPSEKMVAWMQKPKNLGSELRKVCDQLAVNIVKQVFDTPLADEYAVLCLTKDDDVCFVRKIFLEGDGVPFTYGRVVVPKFVYLNHKDKFNSLGSKLIGETLLYGNPKTIRSAFEFSCIDKLHPLFNSLVTEIPEKSTMSESFWARRSFFQLNAEERLLITEVFLDDVPEMFLG